MKCFAHKITLMVPVDEAVLLNPSHDRVGGIFNCGQMLWKRTNTQAVTGSWNLHLQGFVRTLTVVMVAPVGEPYLAFMQITPGMIAQQFDFDGPMKAFVFALCLRMKGARVRDTHA